jgi:PAS domain S-box-containing protein
MQLHSLRLKFALLLGGFGVAIGVIVFTNFDTSNAVASRLDESREKLLPRLNASNALRGRFQIMSQLLTDAAIVGESSFLNDSDDERGRLLQELETLISLTPEQDREGLRDLGRDLGEYHSRARGLAQNLLSLEEGSDDFFMDEETSLLAGQVGQLKMHLDSRLDALDESSKQDLKAQLRSTEEDVRSRAKFTLIVAVVSLLIALTAMQFLTGRIVAPIRALSLATAEVAKGNLDETISVPTSQDEVGDLVQSFALMSTRLKETTVSRDYVDNIINPMGDSLIVLDARSRVVMVNPATTRLLGYDEGVLIGRPFADVLANESTLSNLSGLPQSGITGTTIGEQYLTKEGVAIPVSLVAAVLRRADGQHAGFVCVAQDQTERKKAEQDLRRARDAAEQANLAKSTFLANTSHEIRTPINAIMGMAQALQEEQLPTQAADRVDTVLQASEALTEIIDDLLDLSKIEAGQLEMESQPFDPVEIVERARSTLALRAEDKGISLTVRVEEGTTRDVESDGVRLRQILMNLIGNALKFTESGGVEVRLSSTPEEDRVRLHVRVKDSGIGIDADRQNAIFDPFTQADATVTRTHGGTGLGLSISKRLVEMMDGHIGVDSQPGQGSTFWFDVLVNAGSGLTVPAAVAEDVQVLPLRILLAEDNAINRKVARALLLKDSHEIIEAENGKIAVDLVRTTPPFDAILMDMQMPVMDGLTATQEICRFQAEVGHAPTPIIALTANAMKADRDRCLAAGMVDFIPKPVRKTQLREVLARVAGAAAPPA